MKRKWIKRSICIFLSAALVLGAVLADFLSLKTDAAGVTYNPAKAGVCLLPANVENNSLFYQKNILNGESNCNNQFKRGSYTSDNMKESIGGTLSVKYNFKKENHDNKWYVNYKYTASSVIQELSKSKQLKVCYSGSLGSDKHSNFKRHWDKKWGRSQMSLDVAYGNGSTGCLFYERSYEKNDGQGITVTNSRLISNSSGVKSLNFCAKNISCVCSDCFVKSNVIYMVDTQNPYITKIYASTDAEGKDKLADGEGYKANETFYITLEFNEYIRFASNNAEQLKLNLDFYDKYGQWTDAVAAADLQELSGKKMVFKYTVPETVKGEKTNLRLRKISNQQNWITSTEAFPFCILGSNGKALSTNKYVGLKTTSKITDLAGNGIYWGNSNKNFSSDVLLDNENPKINSITLSGKQLSSDASLNKDSWPADIDRSAVFPGEGDNMTFTVMFSEQLEMDTEKYLTSNTVTAQLNLVDSSKSASTPVTLKANKIWNSRATDVLGKDAQLGQITIVQFEPLVINSDMKPSDYSSGDQLKIVSISGMSNVTDLVGNEMTALNSISMVPRQQQYVDTIPPEVTTKFVAENNVYTPTVSTDGNTFTFAVSVDDVADEKDTEKEYVSGVKGLYADFVLSLLNETGTKQYQYYYDKNPDVSGNPRWRSAYTATNNDLLNGTKINSLKRSIPEFEKEEGNTIYLHIRLNDPQGYECKAGTTDFEGSIHLYARDYAGNCSEKEFALSYNMDKVKPNVQRNHAVTVGSSDDVRVLNETISITDKFGIKDIQYSWDDEPSKTYDLTAVSDIKNVTISLTKEALKSEGETGKKQLKITSLDIGGNTITKVYDCNYSFVKPESKCVVTAGTPSNPVKPRIQVCNPGSMIGSDGVTVEQLSTLVLFKAGDDSFYMFETRSWDSETKDILYDNFCISQWFKLTGKGKDEETGDYIFDEAAIMETNDGSVSVSTIRDKLATYGKRMVTVITLPRDTGIDTVSGYKIKTEYATIEEYDLYQAMGSSYECEFEEILAADGKTEIDSLDYDKQDPDAVPAASLDGVTFNIALNNMKKEIFDYKLNDIDFDKCKIQLRKCAQKEPHTGDDPTNTDEILCEGTLVNSEKQSFTIPVGTVTETGWYYVEVCVETLDGTTFSFCKNDIFIDVYTFHDFIINSYSKTYETNNANFSTQEETRIPTASNINPEKTEVTVGIAEAPQGFVVKENKLAFSITSDSVRVAASEGFLQNNLQFRAWSKNDKNGETSAVWYSLNPKENYVAEYRLLATEEFSPALYRTDKIEEKVLPLTVGDNVVCYQVKSTNGQIVTKEILVHAMGTAPEFDLLVEINEDKTEAKISPVIKATTALLNPQFRTHDFYSENNSFGAENDYDSASADGRGITPITVYQSGEREFYLFDSNANLGAKSVKITDVDGLDPQISFVNDRTESEYTDSMVSGELFHFTVKLADNEDVRKVAGNLYLTFDEAYSELLRRGSQEAVSSDAVEPEAVRIPIPVNQNEDENYVWESFSEGNYGIFRTQMHDFVSDSAVQIDIWGAIKYDDQKEESAKFSSKFTLDAYDSIGNPCSRSREYDYYNVKPDLSVIGGATLDTRENSYYLNDFNWSTRFGPDGNLQADINVPVSQVSSYGAGNTIVAFDDYYFKAGLRYRVPFSMIKSDGEYDIDFVDLFGNSYQDSLNTRNIEGPSFQKNNNQMNIEYYFSEKNITNQDVSVIVKLKNPDDADPAPSDSPDSNPSYDGTSGPEEIATIAAVTVDEDGEYDIQSLGQIDKDDPAKAGIVLEQNGTVLVQGICDGNVLSEIIQVSNIDKTIEEVTPYYIYNGNEEPEEIKNDDTVYGTVKVALNCEEDLEGIDGPLYYSFTAGSKKGDTHTFHYKDTAGNTGSKTVELPYNVEAAEVATEPGWEDNESPSADIDVYALRNEYKQLTTFADEDNEGNTGIINEVCQMANDYQAREYKLLLDIDDESLVKVIVKNTNADAPTSYENAVSDEIAGVKNSGNVLTITKNSEFDLYLIDKNNNRMAFKGFSFTNVTTEEIGASIEYQTLRDEDGGVFVRAYLNSTVTGEALIATNSDINKVLEKTGEKNLEGGGKEDIYSIRYYHDFTEKDAYKGKYEFVYKDSSGNIGKVQAEVKGIDYSALILNNQQWFGTVCMDGKINTKPDKEGLKSVSHDVATVLKYNKAVSQVKLYEYDASAVNHKGAELAGDKGVGVTVIGNKVTVTYSANYAGVLVLCAQADNGKTLYQELPAVQCIDKQPPIVIEFIKEDVADNHLSRKYTIKTDEQVVFENRGKLSVIYEFMAVKNGKKVVQFKDEAGNTTEYEINVDGIDDTELILSYGRNAGTLDTNNPEELNLMEGDTLFVKANKAADITIGNGKTYSITANGTVSIPLNTKSGIYALKAVDKNTGKTKYANICLSFKDKEAPTIRFSSNAVVCLEGTALDDIEAELKKGVVIEDNVDGFIGIEKIEISGIPESSAGGSYFIIYKATDSSGNKTEGNRVLYLYNQNTPFVIIDGERTIPLGLKVVSSPILQVKAGNTGLGPVTLKYKEGIKTSAQMKYYAEVSQLTGTEKEQQLTLPNRRGFYTIYIRTQNRTELVTYVYVDISE